MADRFRFNRMELAGSLGDLGTLLPIAMGMIILNGLNPLGIFFSAGLYFIVSGTCFGVTVPVQPMKVIGAYAIAMSLTAPQIHSSTLIIGLFLLVVGLTGLIDAIRKHTPPSVIRGVQLSTGTLLATSGIKFMIGTSPFQVLQKANEPYLTIQQLGPIPIGIVIGAAGGLITLLLLENRKFPAGLVVVLSGVCLGLLLGAHKGLERIEFGIHWPTPFAFDFPNSGDLSFALVTLVLPQLPMTIGNAVLAYVDLSKSYFGEKSGRVTAKNACLSMGLANLLSFCAGGMPMCHGAGGLAAHYRFGARTAGSNLMIGGIFLFLALFFGRQIVVVLNLIPLSILGVLLLYAGSQLALTIMDLENRRDWFVAVLILGITLASNLAAGFIAGIVVSYALKWDKLSI